MSAAWQEKNATFTSSRESGGRRVLKRKTIAVATPIFPSCATSTSNPPPNSSAPAARWSPLRPCNSPDSGWSGG